MWNGKNTTELEQLKREYASIYGHNPDIVLGVEYDDGEYSKYVNDLKRCIKDGDLELDELADEDFMW